MAEQTFRSPGFFEREIDLSEREQSPVGIPAGVIGTAERGPAFVPVTIGSIVDFVTKFGNLDKDKFGPYAVNEFMKHRTALTFCRVLGAGANRTDSQITTTITTGKVRNAGTVVTGSLSSDAIIGPHNGAVQFIVAAHTAVTNEAWGMPYITDNDSFSGTAANMIRAVVFLASDSRLLIYDANEVLTGTFSQIETAFPDDLAHPNSSGEFKLIISSSAGSKFTTTDGYPGLRVLTASLNPGNANYIANILNTNPAKFADEKHYLYADFAVDNEIAAVNTTAGSVGLASGSLNISSASGDTTLNFRDAFGFLDDRYRTPTTTYFISQPYGNKEYDLFRVESLHDGAYANERHKISISNIKKSSDVSEPYGTFALLVRAFGDTDGSQKVVEEYYGLSLNPTSENYIAKMIGDKKITFNFDAEDETERRHVVRGKYPNKSKHIRVVMSSDIINGVVPKDALPFGFRGLPVLKTNDNLNDNADVYDDDARLGMSGSSALSGSIVPPIPFRVKVTRGSVNNANPAGDPGTTEIINPDYFWGVKFERSTAPLNPNPNDEQNRLIPSLTRFFGHEKLDVLVTGSWADTFNNNKFTLARVALRNTALAEVTASANDHMLEAIYLRNAKPDTTLYTVDGPSITGRYTLATLASLTSSVYFNKFVSFNKFTTFMYGGWDGNNILDADATKMNDKATSIETGGGAATTFTSPGLATNIAGTGESNNAISSYDSAITMMTDPYVVNTNLLVIPGIREPFVTDTASDSVRDYKMAMYIADPPLYDENSNRIYDDRSTKPDVEKVIEKLDSRAIDNNYVATYFPDVTINDSVNNRRVRVPGSIPALAAIAFNDKVAYPWFAPAGFNRGEFSFVEATDVRLSSDNRNDLQDARINPITSLPRTGFVIYGQKTMQLKKSALDRVNVRRLMLDVKRIISDIALNLTFEANVASERAKFVGEATQQLAIIQAQSGIESFKVIMDGSNNKKEDIEANRINGTVVVIPTRTVEHIAVDFIISTAGVEFV